MSSFEELSAHPALARALASRGYDAPTPVQEAVLTAADGDLLVSSQTGSGKTVAFGLLLARVLLGAEERFKRCTRPRALVIAPTRELAVQVHKELSWLFQPTGARLLAFTGGTDLRQDLRALKGGVELVVGTPGRLVDLVERKGLDLEGLEAVVLDEADEMLDLGFREALAALLDRAPAERRTLLFSATLPSEIRALAAKYQKRAIHIDPRGAGARPSAHEDIRHVCHLVANGDRVAAVVNVLLQADEERAIVFCARREGVAEMHRQLGRRGFSAVAMSGDRAQAERTRALDAVRGGSAKILVATNVAARGLDLPDVGLVVHADLPENPEALTHRSGRTGRAGKKGVNVLIAEMGERRRAERLFQLAHVVCAWTAAPSASAIAAADRERVFTQMLADAEAADDQGALELADRLLTSAEPSAIVAALLKRALTGRPTGEALRPVDLKPKPRHPSAQTTRPSAHPSRHSTATATAHVAAAPAGKPRAAMAKSGVVLFQVNLGAKDNAEPGWLLPLVCRRGSITRKEVGAIRVGRDSSTFEIAADAAEEFGANASERDPRAPNVRIERAAAGEDAKLAIRSWKPLNKKHPRRK